MATALDEGEDDRGAFQSKSKVVRDCFMIAEENRAESSAYAPSGSDLKVTLKTADKIDAIKPIDFQFEIDFEADGCPDGNTLSFEQLSKLVEK